MGNLAATTAATTAKGQSVKIIYWRRGKASGLVWWREDVVPHGGHGKGKESSLVSWREGVVPNGRLGSRESVMFSEARG